MTDRHYALFDTAIGPCGIAWSERGILAVRFAEGEETKTREKLLRRVPGATQSKPTPTVQHAIDGVVALLSGEPRDLADIVIDDAQIPPFNRKVYAIARQIPPGRTMTYGEIAERLGDKLLARDVGTALGENPTPIIMPCHRVLAADGKTGGFSAPGGVSTKLRLLTIEGAQPGGPTLFESLPLVAPHRRRG
jgi:methylated-DNA-[protein]-cysteine S-methyltransferase